MRSPFLLCFLLSILSCLEAEVLDYGTYYLIEIEVPPSVGRDEAEDVAQIRDIFQNASDAGINVMYSFKEMGNFLIIALVKVEKDCSWPQLTGPLVKRGDKFTAIPVVTCNECGLQLGIDIGSLFTDLGDETYHFAELKYPLFGRSSTKYFDVLRKHLQAWEAEVETGSHNITCFRAVSDIPIMMYMFHNIQPSESVNMMQDLNLVEDIELRTRLMENLSSYGKTCQ